MSRCFSYPPPGYTGTRGSNEALIESIKLQRERELAKAERKKEKKREKKEKKKEKKEKAKQNTNHSNALDKTNKVKKSWAGPKDVYPQKLIEDETEHLERSGLTEEHGQPVGLENPSTSSDSTQNSSKRKRHSSSVVVEQEERVIRGRGNVLIFRLPQKKKAVDASVTSQKPCSTKKQRVVDASVRSEEPCSTSGTTELPVQLKLQVAPEAFRENSSSTLLAPNSVSEVLPLRHEGGAGCSISGRTEAVILEQNSRTASGNKLPEKRFSKGELRYKSLTKNWNPPPLQSVGFDDDDQDWLFAKRGRVNNAEKKLAAASNNVLCRGSSTLFPRAQLLVEADIYALPFTVPF